MIKQSLMSWIQLKSILIFLIRFIRICSDVREEPDYIVTVPADQADRQISARYPSEEQIRRASIMTDFNAEDSERINQMWIRVRCYNIHNVPVWAWPLGIAALAGILVWVIRKRRRESF